MKSILLPLLLMGSSVVAMEDEATIIMKRLYKNPIVTVHYNDTKNSIIACLYGSNDSNQDATTVIKYLDQNRFESHFNRTIIPKKGTALSISLDGRIGDRLIMRPNPAVVTILKNKIAKFERDMNNKTDMQAKE